MKRSSTSDSSDNKLNVILDLDNTLLYSFDLLNPEPKEKIPKFVMDGKVRSYPLYGSKGEVEFLVTERPGLQPFLKWLFRNFQVSVWSAGSPEYVAFIVEKCIETKARKIKNVYNSKTCEKSTLKFDSIKDLRLLYKKRGPHYRATNTLIVDDLPEVNRTNPDNSIRIVKYSALPSQSKDTALIKVKDQLVKINKNFKKYKQVIL